MYGVEFVQKKEKNYEGEIFHDTPRGTHEGDSISLKWIENQKSVVSVKYRTAYRTMPRLAIGPNPTFLYSTRIRATTLQMARALGLYP